MMVYIYKVGECGRRRENIYKIREGRRVPIEIGHTQSSQTIERENERENRLGLSLIDFCDDPANPINLIIIN